MSVCYTDFERRVEIGEQSKWMDFWLVVCLRYMFETSLRYSYMIDRYTASTNCFAVLDNGVCLCMIHSIREHRKPNVIVH